jgi:hypothetical protein
LVLSGHRRDLDEVAARVVEDRGRCRAHLGRLLREPDSQRSHALELRVHVFDRERGERDPTPRFTRPVAFKSASLAPPLKVTGGYLPRSGGDWSRVMNGVFRLVMPWVMNIRRNRLSVDLRPGLVDDEWDQLLDAIIAELGSLERVQLVIPEEYDTGAPRQLLDALTRILSNRRVQVQLRRKP